MATPLSATAALDRARAKAYIRLLPILFLSYVIAYVDRVNIGFAKLEMQGDLAPLGFSESVFGYGMGIFFIGYLILEIPGTLIVERWSARKWISRIMISWGIVAAMTAFVRTPVQFYALRFLLGLAEAGFYPGVIVFLTHWFPRQDRTKTLAWFFIGTPVAAIIGPPISERVISIGMHGNPPFCGMVGWQWVFILWGIPAVILGILVLAILADRPSNATWLTDEERQALETTLQREKHEQKQHSGHMTIGKALANPKVLALAAAYFFVVTGSYGVEMYMASIVRDWYGLEVKRIAYLIIIPPIGALISQLLVGWNSDRTHERRWHAAMPIILGSIALAFIPKSQGTLWLTMGLFTLAMIGMKAYLPAFWALPSMFLTESAAAASIGLINACGNLGGFFGPSVIGKVKEFTGEYRYGLWYLSSSVIVSAVIIVGLGIGRYSRTASSSTGETLVERDTEAVREPDAVIEPA
jgi:MFS transporter, ACS family, tartrate transporter